MKLERFLKVRKSALDFCHVAYNGKISALESAESMTARWTTQYCPKTKSSSIVVYISNVNYGTTRFPRIVKTVCYQDISSWRETEKTFRRDHEYYRGYDVINKSSILGWLTK